MVVGTDRDRKTGALMALLAHSDGLKYAGAAFITLGGDERREFLAEVERLTTSLGFVQVFAGDMPRLEGWQECKEPLASVGRTIRGNLRPPSGF